MTTSLPPTDAELAEAVAEELSWLPSAEARRVSVAVERGTVSLTGQVDTLPEKRAAVEAAFRVRGVTAVADEIAVHDGRPLTRDAAITRAVIDVLTHTVPAPGRVKADVREHVVVLTGTVDWSFQRDVIARSVESVVGVVGVVDEIVVRRRPSAS